jgi:hypothetical protein
MFERYTEKAKLTIFRAKHEADALGSREINSAHILLALLNDAVLAKQVLAGVPLQELREEILAQQPHRTKRLGPGDLPLSPEVKQMLASVAEKAHESGSTWVCNGHILLGLMRAEGPVAEAFRNKRILIENIRPQIEALILDEGAEEGRLRPTTRPIQDATEQRVHGMVADIVERKGAREALKHIDHLLADPRRDRNTTLRELWFTAIVLAKSVGDLQLVRHYCQEFLTVEPEDPSALYELAVCLQQQGHREQARIYAERAYANLSRSSRKALPDLLRSQWPELGEAERS